jgi:hypothetical protein
MFRDLNQNILEPFWATMPGLPFVGLAILPKLFQFNSWLLFKHVDITSPSSAEVCAFGSSNSRQSNISGKQARQRPFLVGLLSIWALKIALLI